MLTDININQNEIEQMNWSEKHWPAFKDFLQAQNTNVLINSPDIDAELRHMLQERQTMVNLLFPLEKNE